MSALSARIVALGTALILISFSIPARADDRTADLKMGASVFKDLATKHQIVSDSPYNAVLQSVGRRISAAAQPHWFVERFYVVRGNQMNAFSAPGGYVFVTEGLLRQADNVPELANVLAHETAHLVLGHVNAQVKAQKKKEGILKIGKSFANVFGGGSRTATRALDASTLASNYGFLNFSRQQEFAADKLGIRLAAKARYDPWGSVWFLQESSRLYGDAGFEAYVQHHPSIQERVKQIESYFKADPRTYARWSSRMPAGTGLPSSE